MINKGFVFQETELFCTILFLDCFEYGYQLAKDKKNWSEFRGIATC